MSRDLLPGRLPPEDKRRTKPAPIFVDATQEEPGPTDEAKQRSCSCKAAQASTRRANDSSGGLADFQARIKDLQNEQCTCSMRDIRGKSKSLTDAITALEESLKDLRAQHENHMKQCKERLFQKTLFRNMQACEIRMRLDEVNRRLANVDQQLKSIERFAEGDAKTNPQ